MKITVLGAGAYGLALATVLNEKNDVTVYSVIKSEIDSLNETYRNEKLFPNIEISRKIKFTNNIDEALKDTNFIVIAIPTNYLSDTVNLLNNKINKDINICIASKGINNKECKFAYDIVHDILKTDNISVLAGPSFAIDTIKKENIILSLAGNNIEDLKKFFPSFIKIETTSDIIGVELCGTLKNIFAISCGILDGMNTSESTKSSYLTKIINETTNIIYKFNGLKETILLSCGIGDIILTCSSKKSRNFSLGYLIGSKADKNKIEDYLKNTTVEGLDAIISIKKVFEEKNIKSEIIDLIYDIILNNDDPKKLLNYIVK